MAGERPEGCVFCLKIASDEDDSNHVLLRGEHNVVILNTYPYNSGHLMVVPHAHVGTLAELTQEAGCELWDLTGLAAQTVREALHPQGLNIGMNIGEAAGAGIGDHLHMHIVPRWNGDTNYMTTVAETRVVPQSLEESFEQLKPVIDRLVTGEDQ